MTHRLDAWMTSIAYKRLEDLRQNDLDGLHIGGCGWVEDLRPDRDVEPVDPPEGEDARVPLWRSPSNKGYVHAPSLGHPPPRQCCAAASCRTQPPAAATPWPST